MRNLLLCLLIIVVILLILNQKKCDCNETFMTKTQFNNYDLKGIVELKLKTETNNSSSHTTQYIGIRKNGSLINIEKKDYDKIYNAITSNKKSTLFDTKYSSDSLKLVSSSLVDNSHGI